VKKYVYERGTWHVWERGEVHTVVWSENPRERNYFEDLGVDGMKMLKWIFRVSIGKEWNGFIWLRILRSDGPL
jgi:hypothetical protein